jgi:hypothetical protein
VGPRAGLDVGARRKILCPCLWSNPDRPARSQTLYSLNYHGSAMLRYWTYGFFKIKYGFILFTVAINYFLDQCPVGSQITILITDTRLYTGYNRSLHMTPMLLPSSSQSVTARSFKVALHFTAEHSPKLACSTQRNSLNCCCIRLSVRNDVQRSRCKAPLIYRHFSFFRFHSGH